MHEVSAVDADGDGVVEAGEMQRYAAGTAAQANKAATTAAIRFADPEGLIPARAKKDTIITFRAASQGQKKFRVFWQVRWLWWCFVCFF